MFAFRRTSPRPNAAHEQHTRTVVLFQIIDIRLETSGISDADPSTRTCFGRHDDTVEWSRNRCRRGHRDRGLHDLCCLGEASAVAARFVVTVSVFNVPGTSGTTRISEYKTAVSKVGDFAGPYPFFLWRGSSGIGSLRGLQQLATPSVCHNLSFCESSRQF